MLQARMAVIVTLVIAIRNNQAEDRPNIHLFSSDLRLGILNRCALELNGFQPVKDKEPGSIEKEVEHQDKKEGVREHQGIEEQSLIFTPS